MTRPPVTPNGLIQALQIRVEALEALVAHLAALGPLNHGPCQVCRALLRPSRGIARGEPLRGPAA